MHDYSSSSSSSSYLIDILDLSCWVFWAQHNFQSQENGKTAKTPQILKLCYPTGTEQVVWVSHAFCSSQWNTLFIRNSESKANLNSQLYLIIHIHLLREMNYRIITYVQTTNHEAWVKCTRFCGIWFCDFGFKIKIQIGKCKMICIYTLEKRKKSKTWVIW